MPVPPPSKRLSPPDPSTCWANAMKSASGDVPKAKAKAPDVRILPTVLASDITSARPKGGRDPSPEGQAREALLGTLDVLARMKIGRGGSRPSREEVAGLMLLARRAFAAKTAALRLVELLADAIERGTR